MLITPVNLHTNKTNMNRLITIFILGLFSFTSFGETPEEYIKTWKDVAINQMVIYQIPASITLAQGILESGSGNSLLATKANNHFGIKCHNWQGKTFHKDDDLPNECFRKYNDASESYLDHSKFLTERVRYAFLFNLEITDFKKWAKGLKQAGYATSPTYATRLIYLIEKYNLDQFDKDVHHDLIAKNGSGVKEKDYAASIPSFTNSNQSNNVKHQVFVNKNRTKYIVAGAHDTFYLIAREFELNLNQMNRWNDFPPTKDVLKKGDKVYIMRKKKKSGSTQKRIEIAPNQTLWDISQEYGIQMKTILEKNQLSSPDIAMNVGDIVYLK